MFLFVCLFYFVVFKAKTLLLGHFHTQPISSHKLQKLRTLGVRVTRVNKTPGHRRLDPLPWN